ncbi:hypothetical protein [Brevundimonas nasdae]|uniref:hypothetical protein n=1 Tax=Brevundimonas nasdae TaxID=172043 RepID=UPI0012EEA2A3|nr:hypothetical protein [Brevundimonas nasdae]
MAILAVLLLGATLAGAAPTQQASPESDPPSDLADVVVEGRKVQEAVHEYVRQVGEPPRGSHLARWNVPMCVSVTNMRPQYAQYVIDRIATNAVEAGVAVGGEGCKPNVFVFATTNASSLASKLTDEAALAFQPTDHGSNLGRRALAEFRRSEAPIRWWNVSMPVMADSGELALTLRGDDPKNVRIRDSSRLRSDVRYDLAWTIVIVDMSKTNGASLGGLADYLTMVSLAQINPRGDFSGQSSIMNLFAYAEDDQALTAWDRNYLSALYSAATNRATASQAESGVVGRMVQETLSKATDPDLTPEPSS